MSAGHRLSYNLGARCNILQCASSLVEGYKNFLGAFTSLWKKSESSLQSWKNRKIICENKQKNDQNFGENAY